MVFTVHCCNAFCVPLVFLFLLPCNKVFAACGEPGERGRQMLLFSATMPSWVDKVGVGCVFNIIKIKTVCVCVCVFWYFLFFLGSFWGHSDYVCQRICVCRSVVRDALLLQMLRKMKNVVYGLYCKLLWPLWAMTVAMMTMSNDVHANVGFPSPKAWGPVQICLWHLASCSKRKRQNQGGVFRTGSCAMLVLCCGYCVLLRLVFIFAFASFQFSIFALVYVFLLS